MNSTPAPISREYFGLACAGFSEETLLCAAKRGEDWAFSELCRRHSRRVYLTIYRITRDQEDTEDALQTALLNAFKHLDQFDSRAQFSTWLTTIGTNAAFMLLRKRRACREVSMAAPEDDDPTPDWDPEDSAPGPQELCLQREMYAQLHSAIELLPERYRSIAKAQIAGEVSMKELAEMFGLSVSAAKSRVLRAKKLLHVRIESMRSRPTSPCSSRDLSAWHGSRSISQHASSLGR